MPSSPTASSTGQVRPALWLAFSVSLLAALPGILAPQPCVAQVQISGVITSSEPVAPSTYTVNGQTVNHGIPSPGNDLVLIAFSAGATNYTYVQSADQVDVRRHDPPSGGPAGTPFGDKITLWSQGSYSGSTASVPTARMLSEEAALSSRALNRGSDNTFDNNRGATISNNIERIDFIFQSGLSVPSAALSESGFPVFERNGGNAFGIAAITSLDAGGNPDTYGPLLHVTSNTANMVVSPFTYVSFKQDDGETLLEPIEQGSPQGIKGVFVRLADLGISAGQTFYGYSLFGEDVTPSHNLVNYSSFPKSETGGADLSGGGHFFALEDALPVELTAFEATADGADVLLRWDTASETNNAGFEIQRISNNGGMDSHSPAVWQDVAFVDGEGTTLEAQAYTYRVSGLQPGRHTFRLKQVDYDGSFEYSPQVEVSVEMPNAFTISRLYPNPFNPQASFSVGVKHAQHVRVDVYNLLGQRVLALFDGVLSANASRTLIVDGHALHSGTYILRVQGEHFADSQILTLVK